jgi:MFS family permease
LFINGRGSFPLKKTASADKQLNLLRPIGYLELLRKNRNFRQLWLGQVVSQLGDWLDTIALYTIVLHLTGSGRAVGFVLVARFLPTFIIGPLSGVLADRFSRRSIMIASDLLRAVVVLGFLLVRTPEDLWLVYVLTVLQLALSTFFEPAKSAAITSIVSTRELLPASTISSATWSAMLTLGSAIGGEVTGWLGTNGAFILDSLTYLVSAALIASVRFPQRPAREKSRLTIGKALGINDMLEGARYVWQRPRLFAALMVKPAWGLGGGILTLLAVFGEKIYPVGGQTSRGIGVLYAARGIGTAIGPIVFRRFAGETRERLQTAIGFSFLIGGLFYIGFASATNFTLALILLAIAHAGGSTLWVNSTVLLQESMEDDFRGRVFAAEFALLTLTMAASNYATGELLDRFNYSPRAVTIGIGILFIIPGLVWFATKRFWDYGQEETRQAAEENTDLETKTARAVQ